MALWAFCNTSEDKLDQFVSELNKEQQARVLTQAVISQSALLSLLSVKQPMHNLVDWMAL